MEVVDQQWLEEVEVPDDDREQQTRDSLLPGVENMLINGVSTLR